MNTDIDINALRADLESTDASRQLAAAEKLLTHPQFASQLAPELVQLFTTRDEGLREVCVGAVENIRPPEARIEMSVAQKLVLFLSGDELQAVWAAKLLGRLGVTAAFAVDDLAKLLTTTSSIPTREEAAWALGQIGPAAKTALSALEAAAKLNSPRLVRYAREAIAKISGE
jgi:HEAT repeat protein